MKIKNIKYYILAFIIPISIFIFILYISNIYPFGNILINKYDSYIQYPSFLIEYISKLKTGQNIFYTLNASLGTNLLGIINLYMGSPLNLLFLLFKKNQIYLFYVILILIKVGLSSLTLYIYFNNKYKKNNNANLLFSIIYALCTFSITYCYHIMWSDAFYLAPLILLGIDKLIDDNKKIYYPLFLTTLIIFNFYMGYMLCIFSVIYFIYKIINYKGQRKNIIINFLILSIISGLMSAFVLIPSAFAILNGRTIGSINYFKINIYNLSSIIYNLFPGSFLKTDNFNDGTCVIGVSLFCLSLIILYFFNKKISKKEKISTLTVILFFILSFSFNLFDYAWNMFTKPVWWNCRYAFLFSLFLIIISHKSFINLKDINVNSKKISITTISIFLLSLVSFSLKVIGTHPKTITAIILFIGNIYIIIYLNLLIKLSKRHNYLNYILILILLLSEIIYNGYYLFHLDNSIKYNNTISTFNKKEKNIKFLKTKDNLFYRIYDYDDSHENNGLIYNYSSAQLFSSVYNKRVNEFYSKYIEVNKTNDSTTNHTEITYPNLELLSLIGTKYLISQNDDIFYKVKKDINRNNYALSPFILVDNNKNINLISYDRYTNINNIYSYLANTKVNLYNDVNPTITYDNLDYNKHNNLKLKNKKKKGILTLNFISNTKGIIVPKNYEYFDDFATIYINDNKIDKDDFLKVNKNDNVKIIYKFNKKTYLNNINLNTLSIKILDIDKFNKTLCNINMPVYTLQNDKQNILNFNLKVNKNNQKLFMTIPYDKGLIIKVDDKEVKYNKEFNTFISINLNKGLHNIKINYFSKGLKLGIIISFSTLILTIFVTICNKKIDKKSKYRYNSIVNYKK